MPTKTQQSETKKVPELRFPGFSGGWEEKRLGEMLSFKNGINASKDQYGHGIKFINVLDIIENAFITYDNIRGSVDITQAEFSKNTVSYGDILFQRSSETREEVGQANVYLDKRKNVTFGGFVIRGRKISDYNPVFFNYLLRTPSIRKDITSRSGGSTRYNVGQGSLEKVVAIIPRVSEQKKIASFLSTVDSWIQNLRAQRDSLEDYKKGMMQKVFLQEVRFRDDRGKIFSDWETKTLGELGRFVSGQGFSNKEQGGVKGTPFYKVSDMNKVGNEKVMGSANHYVTDEQIKRLKYRVIREKSLIFAKVGAAIFLERKRVAQRYILDNNMMAFIPNGNVEFLRHIFIMIRLSKYAQVGALPSYNSSDIAIIKVKIPTSDAEQQKITDLLSMLDNLIAAKKSQITKAEEWKKGVMMGVFV